MSNYYHGAKASKQATSVSTNNISALETQGGF